MLQNIAFVCLKTFETYSVSSEEIIKVGSTSGGQSGTLLEFDSHFIGSG